MDEVTIHAGALKIQSLECRDGEVVEFFVDVAEAARADTIRRALSLGVTGLKAMGVAGQVAIVEREFMKLSNQFGRALEGVEQGLIERVECTFDPDRAQSVSARLGVTIADAHGGVSRIIGEARDELERLITANFNPDLANSCIARIVKLVTDTRAELDRAFDPSYEGSHLSRLASTVDEYFGEDGAIAEAIAAQLGPVRTELMEALQALRDIVVGQAAAAEQRRRSPASGDDFETEVETVLRRIAKSHGDTVERVGTQLGDSSPSKKGDFVVQLREGARFVVEAKDCSNPITLRGDRGILQALSASMTNRSAAFAIAVMKESGGFPKEVGSFNDYDRDKILCHFGVGGELLEAAYRWARLALLSETSHLEVDLEEVEAGIDEARRALRELGRIEAKVKAIVKAGEEIQGLVAFQVRRAVQALDRASASAAPSAAKAS